jgi:hypothetical protein
VRRVAALMVVLIAAAGQYGCSQGPSDVPTVPVSVSSCQPELFGMYPDTVTPAPVGTPSLPSALIPSSLQGRLGAFGTSRDLLLAPIGWTCGAQDAAKGILEVTSPDGSEHIGMEFDRTGDSGLGLSACQAFALVQRQHAFDDSLCVRPSAEVDRAVTSELISFTDPPHVQGAGWHSGGDYESDGLIWYHASGQQVQTATITCTVGPANHDLCEPILKDFQSRLPAPAPGATPAELASFELTAHLTEPPTSPPAGDCAIQLTGAEATVVVRGAGSSACTAAKHVLLPIGVFYTVDPATATKGLGLICSGPVTGISNNVEVWDVGGATYATMVCRGWDLVSP